MSGLSSHQTHHLEWIESASYLEQWSWCCNGPGLPLALQSLLHSKKKSTFKRLVWYFRLSQVEDSIQYLEGPNGIWKDHDRHIGVQRDQMDPNRPVMVLPDTFGPSRYWIESSICDSLKYQKRCLKVLSFLGCISILIHCIRSGWIPWTHLMNSWWWLAHDLVIVFII